ncbi:hypothetical protein V494_06379 [Pseudogymnoascus sp. VKM F-4513 (FW-928)]|nr:hypothetical protein V494_06379 [Pseudogymnoascus sp. VKM F-4513 (FW-928)]
MQKRVFPVIDAEISARYLPQCRGTWVHTLAIPWDDHKNRRFEAQTDRQLPAKRASPTRARNPLDSQLPPVDSGSAMSSLVGSLRAPQCMSCMRRVTTTVGDAYLASTKQQVRGKKHVAKATTVNVRLLKDVTRYGKQGSVIPLPPGRMRNQFFPRRMAAYMTQAEIKEAGLENVTFERDFTFGIKGANDAAAAAPEVAAAPGKTVAVDLDLLSHPGQASRSRDRKSHPEEPRLLPLGHRARRPSPETLPIAATKLGAIR